MAISYRVYKNATDGGGADLSSPYATTSALTLDTSALAYPFAHEFLVRAYDAATGLEDLNADATARLVLDGSGADVTGRPGPPSGLSASATANGGIRVEWAYLPTPGAGTPTSFALWCQIGAINHALTPSATAAYEPGRVAYSADLPGLSDGVTYTLAVRARNAVADDGNTTTATAVADAAGPLPVANLGGAATY